MLNFIQKIRGNRSAVRKLREAAAPVAEAPEKAGCAERVQMMEIDGNSWDRQKPLATIQ